MSFACVVRKGGEGGGVCWIEAAENVLDNNMAMIDVVIPEKLSLLNGICLWTVPWDSQVCDYSWHR